RATTPSTVRLVDADLADPDWPRHAGLTAPLDAVVSTTALHWLAEPALAALYREIAGLLRPGGVFVNGDHFTDERPALAALAASVRTERARRRGVTSNENWTQWWAAAETDPDLGRLVAQRRERGIGGDHGIGVSLQGHLNLLLRAGFRDAGSVWQFGDDHVVVAVAG
ncbi:MAG TPA: class I SAM-dependent methyltransferase, partial [Micromonosporaceae bacterium]|nr:class I SAM-dependent methyltransferase [Micromonosporaceae bacterium]